MPQVKSVIPKYEEGEMHVVRRLGGAVIAQWTALPKEVQDLLIDQARMIHDDDLNVQVREQIRVLIRKHNPNWDGPDA